MTSEMVQLHPGTHVERWTIDKKLGQGGFGAVYKVSDSTGQYALKVEDAGSESQVCFYLFLLYNVLSYQVLVFENRGSHPHGMYQ